MALEQLVKKEKREGFSGIAGNGGKFGRYSAFMLRLSRRLNRNTYNAAISLSRSAIFGVGLTSAYLLPLGCNNGSEDGFKDESMQETDASPDPCSGIECGESGHCAVDERETPLCACDPDYLTNSSGRCERIPPPPEPPRECTIEDLCTKPEDRCTSSNTLNVCLPLRQAQCLCQQRVEATCPMEYSECDYSLTIPHCKTFPERRHLEICPSQMETQYIRAAALLDIVEGREENERAEVSLGTEQRGKEKVVLSCGNDQGIALGAGPLASYRTMEFTLNWCPDAERHVEHVLEAMVRYPVNEKGQYSGSPAAIILGSGSSAKAYQFTPNAPSCDWQMLVRKPDYISGSPLMVTIEAPTDGYLVFTKIRWKEVVCR